jgi:NADH-quinone oxidoreductase subunit L
LDFFIHCAWLIPLFPLVGFLINGFIGSTLPKNVSGAIGTGAVFASFIVAVGVFFGVQADPSVHHTVYLATWFSIPASYNAGQLQVNWEMLIDPLSALMLLIITGIGGLIHLYSTSYMAEDSGYSRFFTYLNLFIFFMLLLVTGNNMVMMFVGWEGVGLCSYLLIGFWFEKKSAADAAKKAFIVNRVGDVGVLIAMFMAFRYFGTLDFYNGRGFLDNPSNQGLLLQAKNPALAHLIVGSPLVFSIITVLTLMIFWGCTGKSAQLPLYTWLPDAMEGPTPVSALIHAATMVTAGVYLVSRTHTLFELSHVSMDVVAIIGIATALFAATIGLVQNDIKRVLAYSTMSQLGYMFAACGVGAFSAGMFHVMTHAFFKACLFLGSGAVIHAMEHAIHERHGHADEHGAEPEDHHVAVAGPDPNDPQDMRNMGGLKAKLPITHATMLVSTYAIAGIPLFSGFFSKDEILGDLAGRSALLWLVGAVTAALTGFYMMRLMYKTFYGSAKTEDAKHTHEATPAVTVPLIILGTLAVIGGYVGLPEIFADKVPFGRALHNFLNPASGATYPMAVHPFLGAGPLLEISSLIALFFVIFAYQSYSGKDGRDLYLTPEAKRSSGGYKLLLNKYYVDEIYNFIFVRGGKAVAMFLWKVMDVGVIDSLVNGVGSVSRSLGGFFRSAQTGYVRNYAFSLLIGALIVVIACVVGSHNLP